MNRQAPQITLSSTLATSAGILLGVTTTMGISLPCSLGGNTIGFIMKPEVVQGDLLNQDVDVIVNAWNRNIIPWWLLIPQGVSGAIKRKAGLKPFFELGRYGAIPLGHAVFTNAGRLPYKGIIHVAGINMLWFATERSIRGSVRSAMEIVNQHGFESVAFPLIGSGSGSRRKKKVLSLMLDEFENIESSARVVIVEYRKVDSPSGK